MIQYTVDHLSDAVLLRDLTALVSHDRVTSATLLAHLAEVDARRLYVPAGYASMFAYCVGELRLSDESTARRSQAARTARRFPQLFTTLAEGRLHLTAECLIAPHLTLENVEELIAAATHRRKCEIEEDLVRRFPFRAMKWNDTATIRPIVQSLARAVGSGSEVTTIFDEQRPGNLGQSPQCAGILDPLAEGPVAVPPDTWTETPDSSLGECSLANAQKNPISLSATDGPENWPVTNPSAETREIRFLVRFTIRKSTHDKLREAQALLSHSMPAGDVAEVLDRALDALLPQLRNRKVGSSSAGNRRVGSPSARNRKLRAAPRFRDRPKPNRYIPAHIRRAVWARDRGQCTFVGPTGQRCAARHLIEFDHVDPVARGGKPTLQGIRLRCRAHNQYEAERAFGSEFMTRKRDEARHSPSGGD